MTAAENHSDNDGERTGASSRSRGIFDSPRWWLLPAPMLAFTVFAAAWLILRPDAEVAPVVDPVARVAPPTSAPVVVGALRADPHVFEPASADTGYGLYRDSGDAYISGWRVGSRAVWQGAPPPGRYAVTVMYHYTPGLGEKPARLGVRVGDAKVASYLALSEEGAPARSIKLGEIEVTSTGNSIESELIDGPGDSTRLRVGPISFISLTSTR